jgi:hypothetical protein
MRILTTGLPVLWVVTSTVATAAQWACGTGR